MRRRRLRAPAAGPPRGRGDGMAWPSLAARPASAVTDCSEGDADRADDDLLARAGIEPVDATRRLAVGHLHEATALQLALEAIHARALRDDAEAHGLHRAVAQLAPCVCVVRCAFGSIA